MTTKLLKNGLFETHFCKKCKNPLIIYWKRDTITTEEINFNIWRAEE